MRLPVVPDGDGDATVVVAGVGEAALPDVTQATFAPPTPLPRPVTISLRVRR